MKVLSFISQTLLKIDPYDLIGHIMSACLRTEHHSTDTVGL